MVEFEHADLSESTFTDVDLSRSRFRNVALDRVVMRGAWVHEMDLSGPPSRASW